MKDILKSPGLRIVENPQLLPDVIIRSEGLIGADNVPVGVFLAKGIKVPYLVGIVVLDAGQPLKGPFVGEKRAVLSIPSKVVPKK